ncbi:hypothetical protein JCM10908_005749 [Rhodotorula pacifica]|uniref:uncharacterized protein n=1 Tax=Rhodotorula pacifica TaxID=1495444 RepID=UPI00316C6135
MLGSLLGSIVGTVVPTTASSSTTPRSESPATTTSQVSTAPSTPAEPVAAQGDGPPTDTAAEEEEEEDPFQRSAFFQRLKTKGRHHRNRIKQIQERALEDTPPKEPDPWECCGGSCGIECVVTMWWEEEKTWRDLRPGWRQIKQRLKDEEEDRQREAEEEAAIARPAASVPEAKEQEKKAGSPSIEISLEDETERKLSI